MTLQPLGESLSFGQLTIGMLFIFLLQQSLSSATTLTCAQWTNTLQSRTISVIGSDQTYIASSFTTNNSSVHCQWRIESLLLASIVRLDFDNFSMELNHDVVLVFDGNTSESPLLAELSGSYIHPPTGIISSGKYMLIQFTTDQQETSASFQANLNAVAITTQFSDLACSATTSPERITSDSGTFYSPRYPSYYPNNAECKWLITASQSYLWVKLDFSEFSTEEYGDYVTVHDGDRDSASVIITLHGFFSSPVRGITSTQRHMFISFKSDVSVSYSGFEANFMSTSQAFIPTRVVSSTSWQGRLEVYRNGQWGLVCNRFFDDTDAQVACYELGYGYVGRYIGNTYAGYGTASFILSGLLCSGRETSLAQCPQDSSINNAYCNSRDDSVSISCTSTSTSTKTSTSTSTRSADSADSENWPIWQWIVVVVPSTIGVLFILRLLYVRFYKQHSELDNTVYVPGDPDQIDSDAVFTYPEYRGTATNGNNIGATNQVHPQVLHTSSDGFTPARGSDMGSRTYEIPTAPAFDVMNADEEKAKPPAYDSLCATCFSKSCDDISLKPCGHAAFCNDCATVLISERLQCPICQERVDSAVPNSHF